MSPDGDGPSPLREPSLSQPAVSSSRPSSVHPEVDPADLMARLRARHDDMVHLLRRLTEIETPSSVPESFEPLLVILEEELGEAGYTIRQVPGHGVGPHLFARPTRRDRARPTQLLLGHTDTVFPVGTLQSMPVATDEHTLAGPGAYDMKAGLVQGVAALRVLHDIGVELPAEPVVLFNSDEEIGSPDSTRWIRMLARSASRAFVLEASFGPEGALKTGRKGVGRFVVHAKGTAAHAGLDPERGVSAVLEISHQIQHLFELNDPDRHVTVNVGRVDGGLRSNVVAPEATAEVDARVMTRDDALRVEHAIHSLEPVQDGVVLRVEGRFGRLPMEQTPRNRRLWQQAERAGAALGLEVGEAVVGGGSDGNTTSLFTATLDGLGAVGDGAHAAHEHVVLGAMPERAALLALLLAGPVEGGSLSGPSGGVVGAKAPRGEA